jgi:hypothetical protein
MLRADAQTTADGPDNNGTAGPATPRSFAWFAEDQARPAQDHSAGQPTPGSGPPATTRTVPKVVHGAADGTRTRALPESSQARPIASRLTAEGRPVSRRALRSEGVKGSNQALNALAHRIKAELADAAALPAGLEDAVPRSLSLPAEGGPGR